MKLRLTREEANDHRGGKGLSVVIFTTRSFLRRPASGVGRGVRLYLRTYDARTNHTETNIHDFADTVAAFRKIDEWSSKMINEGGFKPTKR